MASSASDLFTFKRFAYLFTEAYIHADCSVRVRAMLTVILYDELGSWSRRWIRVIRRQVGGDEFQLDGDGAGVGEEDDLLPKLAAAGRHAAPTYAVANHRHVVAGLLRPGSVADVDERQQRHVDALSFGGAHLPRARRRPNTGRSRHRAGNVRRLVSSSHVVSRVTLVYASSQH